MPLADPTIDWKSSSFHPAPLQNVTVASAFWTRIRDTARTTTIPAIIDAQKSTGHWYCLTWKHGHPVKPHPFWDSDIFKLVEAACYFLMQHDDEIIMAVVEEAVEMIRNAQHPDGYINSYYTVRELEQRWTNIRDMHEMYCIGHLLEATVAYETLTRSGRLLEPAMKVIQHVDSFFGLEDGKMRGYPGHQEIEIGLLRFYEFSKEHLALRLAEYFILERGRQDEKKEIYYDQEARARGADPYADMESEHKPWYHGPRDYGYQQADCTLVKTCEVKGHAVRAMYYYTAATDLVRLVGYTEVNAALHRLWRDLMDKKLYVTGGIGSVGQSEGFGAPYALGDTQQDGTCYAETCATFALIVWCQRMLRIDLNSEYSDVMEICLYNGFLGAISSDGEAFYYQNPLRTISGDRKERSRWFGVACCPPNVAKLLASLGSYIYTYDQNFVAVHLYIGSDFHVPGSDIVVSQKTNMPWSGDVEITVVGGSMAVALRIPSWAKSNFKCSVQGAEVINGYLFVAASAAAQGVTLSFAVTPRPVFAHPSTRKDDVAIMRGPLVYCAEDVDNADLDMSSVALSMKQSPLIASSRDIGGYSDLILLEGWAKQLKPWQGSLYGSEPWEWEEEERKLVLVPYFARANRGGTGGMTVWLKRS